MALLTMPKLDAPRLLLGSLRLMWLRTLVKVPSALTCKRSVMVNVLLTPAERLTSPGPSTTPFPALPKRPMGSGCGPDPLPVRQGLPSDHVLSPGQLKRSEERRVGKECRS